jgi:SAM-dependent methyltransferase
MSAGLAYLTGASVVGFDIDPTDTASLEVEVKARGFDLGGIDVQFRSAVAGTLDAADHEFDMGVSWSVLEHVFDRVGFMSEARRVIKPYGHLFLQVWPLWHSAHGHHLWQWLDPFDHLRLSRDEIVEKLRVLDRVPAPLGIPGGTTNSLDEYLVVSGTTREEWLSQAMTSYDSCNRITVDEVQYLLIEHGFCIGRLELMAQPVQLPADLQSVPLTRLSPDGFKLTAWRKP